MPLDSCRSKEVPCSPLQIGMKLLWEKKKTWGTITVKAEGTVGETRLGSEHHLAAQTLPQQSCSRCATGISASRLQSSGFGPHALARTEILARHQTACKLAPTSAEAEHD